MKYLKHIAWLLVLTGGWVGGFAFPCSGAPVMVEKNLFAPDRKPPSPEATAPTPQANKAGLSSKAVQLDGVFIRGDIKKAIMRVKGQIPGADKGKAQNPYVTVKEGEKIGDLQVVKIETRSVSLEKDGQIDVIKLFAEGKVVPPAPPAPAVQGASPAPPGQVPQAPDVARAPGQPPQPPGPPGAAGGNVPAVAPAPPGGQRAAMPPAQMHPSQDMNPPEDEGEIEEPPMDESGG